jgi:aspartyl/asparaginyl beta-hydroxylase (cupin superfamily)
MADDDRRGEVPVEAPIAYVPPLEAWPAGAEGPAFYSWRTVFPFLQSLLDARPIIQEEARLASRWHDWPEDLYNPAEGHQWRVVPFLHTFPATDASKSAWVEAAVRACPRTAALLKRIPTIRTALFSRMGPNTTLSPHTGWADLSNHVLRCHIPLDVPPPPDGAPQPVCGMTVDGETRFHEEGDVLVFDDSHLHTAFNLHPSLSRTILLVDLERPAGYPPGTATGGTTEELEAFMAYFA